jgi:hypothetical protein
MTDYPAEVPVEDCGDGVPGKLRHLEGGEYELYDSSDALMASCEPGDTMYIEPYVYTCRAGRWVRSDTGIK